MVTGNQPKEEQVKDEIMTTVEAAELLGIDRASVARLIRNGTLRAERFGRAWMVYRESVEDFLKRTQGKSKFDRTRSQSQE